MKELSQISTPGIYRPADPSKIKGLPYVTLDTHQRNRLMAAVKRKAAVRKVKAGEEYDRMFVRDYRGNIELFVDGFCLYEERVI